MYTHILGCWKLTQTHLLQKVCNMSKAANVGYGLVAQKSVGLFFYTGLLEVQWMDPFSHGHAEFTRLKSLDQTMGKDDGTHRNNY